MSLDKFKKDLKAFHQSWELISHKASLLEDKSFMLKMAQEVQSLHYDIDSTPLFKKIKRLLF